MIDVEENGVPEWWPVCQNDHCPMAEECLRRLACKEMPEGTTRWMSVLPSALKDGHCQYFEKAEKVTMVRGMKALFGSIGDAKVRHMLRIDLTGYFGSKGTFYRYKDGERWINPQLRQMIASWLKGYGCEQEPVFDFSTEGYDFTRLFSGKTEPEDEKSQGVGHGESAV